MRRRRPPRPLRLTHDLVDVVERVLEGGVLVEDEEDGRHPRLALRAEPPWLSIPLGHIDVLSIHAGHHTQPATGPGRPGPQHRH